jgi:pullulanase/glycogen debranching enzyme
VSTTIERRRSTDAAPARKKTSVQPGEPFPLAATNDAQGANFSIFSEVADCVELCP